MIAPRRKSSMITGGVIAPEPNEDVGVGSAFKKIIVLNNQN